ncbi:MAG: hypothetical protein B7Z37_04790 [Verrucomicrobia bacterium 12-59-8]|nr:MAG: hypothetical protein B7Z37_04790 [Verrucomicrobia bacterium 12-59-8]
MIIVFLSGLPIVRLPISQLPNVVPVTVMMSITYPGECEGAGGVGADPTGSVDQRGTDPKEGTVNVLNRVNQVKNRLPPWRRVRLPAWLA